jgi:hypothetical protein
MFQVLPCDVFPNRSEAPHDEPELTMKMAFSLALLLAAATSQAQPIEVIESSSTWGHFFDGGTDGALQVNVAHAYTITGSEYSFNLRGDVTAQMLGTADTFGLQAAAFFTIETGAAPVQLTNITVSYNAKEVLSGGSTATYTATQYYSARLGVSGFGSDIAHFAYLPDRTTQGVYVEDLSASLPFTILAANTSYLLYMDVYPILRLPDYPGSSSMLGYALEFGGTVAPQFGGVTLSFLATPVPEPASFFMLGLGLAALAVRRRAVR